MAKGITKRSEDYSRWYTDVIREAQLAEHAPVKGCMVIRPYGFAIWEHVRDALDAMIKETGHENACFPLLIPESLLTKEAEHVEGFSPECAVVTHGGGKKLDEPLYIRPTSEAIICSTYAKWMSSWRDLPILVNQWANIVRWEMRTRLFLRTTEFLWQEGHTAHETADEAMEEVLRMLDVYRALAEDWLAIPVIKGEKSESERFAGAVGTYAIEAMMQDRRALQAGTSHFLGQNFAKAYDMQFQGRSGSLEHAWSTSWGVSTRLIGGLIMSHSDDQGLVVPPKVAPIQAVVVPIYKTDDDKETVVGKAREIAASLKAAGVRVKVDERDHLKPGAKFFEWEKKGVPIRVELGPRDIAAGKVVFARRDVGKEGKAEAPIDGLAERVVPVLDEIQQGLFDRALALRKEQTFDIDEYGALTELLNGDLGFVNARWCGSPVCEEKVKDDTTATIRVIPEDGTDDPGKCVVCGEDAEAEARLGAVVLTRARLIQEAIEAECDLSSRGLVLLVDAIELLGDPPEVLEVWATLHFLPSGSPFCCGEPGCHLGLSGDRLARLSDHLRRKMGLSQDLRLDFGDRIGVQYHAGVRFRHGDD